MAGEGILNKDEAGFEKSKSLLFTERQLEERSENMIAWLRSKDILGTKWTLNLFINLIIIKQKAFKSHNFISQIPITLN